MTKHQENLKLTPLQQRAIRAASIIIKDAEPYGWIAFSEDGTTQYHIYCDPETRTLVCTCADFIFRSDAQNAYECKHIVAGLKHVARAYLQSEYHPTKQLRAEDKIAA